MPAGWASGWASTQSLPDRDSYNAYRLGDQTKSAGWASTQSLPDRGAYNAYRLGEHTKPIGWVSTQSLADRYAYNAYRLGDDTSLPVRDRQNLTDMAAFLYKLHCVIQRPVCRDRMVRKHAVSVIVGRAVAVKFLP